MLNTEIESVNNYPLGSPLTSSGFLTASDFSAYLNPLQMPVSVGNHSISPKTIAFIDSNVADAMTIAANLEADIKVILDPTRDGISQITETLSRYDDLTGVEIISHGNVAELQLGNSLLSTNSLQQYAPSLQKWAASLTPDADILFYSCSVASGELGQTFINDISALTGADVAASTNSTGDSAKGGDWTLEYTTGSIETVIPFDESLISTYQGLLPSLFTTQTPALTNLTDGSGSAGDYELGMEFQSAKAGQISSIRYYKAPSETGPHIGKIWSSNGTLLASVTFTNETASGWQQQALPNSLTIQPNTTYVVSVNVNSYYVATNNGIASTITNGDISAVADGSNGVYNGSPGLFPTQSYQNSNYFRDIVFTPTVANPSNNPGTVGVSGTPTQNQTLTANVADTDGLTGVTINYQWQQLVSGNWTNIAGATSQTLNLTQARVNNQVRVTATYRDALGTSENVTSNPTAAVANVNDLGLSILAGSATNGGTLQANTLDTDGLTGISINYQWQQFTNNVWTNITGATSKVFALGSSFIGQQVRAITSYIDALGGNENISSSAVTVAAQNAIVVENQKAGTTAWKIPSTNQATTEIEGFADATSINKGQAINLKISLAQAGQYQIDVYRLGYYGGAGGRQVIPSITGLNGVKQSGSTTNPNTRLVEYNWNTSYTLQTDASWTSGLYFAKLTDSRTGKQNYIQFTVRDDNRPADLGFQDAIATAQAYNNYGGYSVYDFNSNGGQRAYQVSFDRPFQYNTSTAAEQFNNTLTWEYNMTRWLESQGYDVSYYTSLDVSTNPLQLYSQKTFLSVGHDEYWSGDQRNNVEKARDNGTNLAFFSANTAYWQVRYDPSTSGQANRVMTIYKDSTGIGTNPSLDPIAQTNPTVATTLFRSPQVNRPENALLGVGYIGDIGAGGVYQGFDYVVSNAFDPYYANTGLQNGDRLTGLVGYEYDGLLNNGLAPAGLVILSQSPVPSSGLGSLGILPPGTNDTISNAVRYTAPSGAKVFSVGSIQWVWGLDSSGVTNPRVDSRAQQIAVNIFNDMGAKPQTPASGIVIG
jgi:Domain of unknown function (DUF4347)/Domain of unknown function (DUF4082)